MRKLFFNIFCIVTLIIILPFKGYSTGLTDDEMKLYVGQAKAISVSSPKRIAIGNPLIADVADISKLEFTINPKVAENTTLIVWDNSGEKSYRINVLAEDTSLIKHRVDNMLSALDLPGVYTKAEDEEDKVLLLGSVKNAKDKDKIALALAPVKSKIMDLIAVKEEEAVIEIDVQVIELNRGYQDTLGFTWPGSINLTEVGSHGISAAGTTWGKLFKVADETRAAFTLKLDALIQEGKARILSRPRLSCQSGKEAKLVVGGEVPVLSGTPTPSSTTPGAVGATTSASVTYKEYGVILNIKPTLEESGRIHLNLNVEVSEVGDTVSTSYALAYTMTKRTADTELFLDDGQTMGLGGLIKKKSKEELKRVPWLSDIPVLGAFFRQRTTQQGWKSDTDKINDTELFITLTPHLVIQEKPQKELKSLPVDLPAVSSDNLKDSALKSLKMERVLRELKSMPVDFPIASGDDLKDPFLRYSQIVQKRILGGFSYPEAAKKAGFQGTVKLSLKLSPQGDLLDAKIKETSGYRILNDAALKTAQATSPYPPFPPEIKEKEIWMDIPIIYQLN